MGSPAASLAANPFVGDFFRIVGILRNDFYAFHSFKFRPHIRRILSAEDHYFGHFLAGFANLPDGDHQQTYSQQGHQQEGNCDHGNQRSLVAQRIDQFLAVNDADISQAHCSTTSMKISSRFCLLNR
jgi:hypothetical protein